jgi:uncharacterized protein (TIGR03437 family)
MANGRKLWLAGVALLLFPGSAFPGYYFLHYTSATGPFTPAPEKFDLTAQPDGMVRYFVAAQGPSKLAPGDSFESVLSQIRAAADIWSGIQTSALHLVFGGLSSGSAVRSTPGIDVLFDELPPGVVAMAGPTVKGDIVGSPGSPFVPITRAVLILQKDLSEQPSFSQTFFSTVVHEMGHTLGLQHSMTSGAMSTQVTRSTTRSEPLSQDDIAALSWLYPTPEFATRTGTLAGRVTMNGSGVHLASVVAISPGGLAVSALTDPDGVYRLSGLLPGQYYVYVHPLPAALQQGLGPADVVLPVGPGGSAFPPGPVFLTEFYPGTQDVLRAEVLPVAAGVVRQGIDFAVQARGALELYGVTTYSFPGKYAVKPAFLNTNGNRPFLVASGGGLTMNGAATPGLRVIPLGGSLAVPDDGVQAYPPAPDFLQVNFLFNPFSAAGPRHLIFAFDNDLYVLPAALHLVRKQPPSISSVQPFIDEKGRNLAKVIGTGFSASTQVLFDGLPAPVISFDPLDPTNQILTVIPPVGSSTHRAVVSALDPDGQDSLFVDALAPPTYIYDFGVSGSIHINPGSLPAGSEAMVEITGANTHFVQGETVVGFGTSDILVRRVWVLSPTRLLADVRVAPTAAPTVAELTVVTGFEVLSLPCALQTQPANPAGLVVDPRLLNPITNLPSVYAGGQAVLRVNIPVDSLVSLSITLNDEPAIAISISPDGILFTIPPDVGTGPAVLRVVAGSRTSLPVVVQIDPPPPIVLAVYSAPGVAVDASHPAALGQTLIVKVSGLSAPGIDVLVSQLRITVGGVDHVPAGIIPSDIDPDVQLIQFTLSSTVPAGTSVPLEVRVGDRLSSAFLIVVVPAH